MTRPQPKLCIGGTNDGRRVTALHGSVARIPKRQEAAHGTYASPTYVDTGETSLTIAIEDYRAFDHGLGGHKFSVWVPSEWSDEQAATEVFGRIAKMWSGVVGFPPATSDLERYLVERLAVMMAKEEAEAARRFIEGDGKPLPRGIISDGT